MKIKNNVPYVNTEVCDKAIKIAQRKFKCKRKEIGVLFVELRKNEYEKHGAKYVNHNIDFLFWDTDLRKMGIVKQKEVQRFKDPQSATQ